MRLRELLLREFEQNSQENGYLLNVISRRYEDGDAADLTSVVNPSRQLAGLSGYAIQHAAQKYLDTANYVQVMLVPEKR
ncbi:MAG: hypothetical protein DMF90_26815 [Acidobacteria bacterium]|nr:MAG: hypothetical protein DMF90_26815 [Acidobacteriota bacterium]